MYFCSLIHILQVQRSLSAVVVNKSTCSVPGQTGQTASGLSKVLARVLTATESKENEDEAKYEDCTEDVNVSGEETLIDLVLFIFFIFKNSFVC